MPIDTSGIDHKKLKNLINKSIDEIKDHDVIIDLFEKYDVDIDEIHNIPICFAKIDVSARTDHGCIYLNIKLKPSEIDHYLVHEIGHWLQQTTGNKPTQGANDGSYLDNKYEIEGFQNQVEYIADTRSEKQAEEYVEDLLDHHNVNEKRDDKKEELMEAVSKRLIEFSKFGE